MPATSRDLRYGSIAVKNNWITQEQLDENLDLLAKLQRLNPERPPQLPQVLREKGLISDVQHEMVVQTLAKVTSNKRKASAPAKRGKQQSGVKCPHCGTLNRRGVDECVKCEGFIPPEEDDQQQIGLMHARTCPSCMTGLDADTLECPVCKTNFCPECKKTRALLDPVCRHCGFVIPGMERAAAQREKLIASGRIKTKPREQGPAKTHMAWWVQPAIGGGIALLVAILFWPKSGPELDTSSFAAAEAKVTDAMQKGDYAFQQGKYTTAIEHYKQAERAAKGMVSIAGEIEDAKAKALSKLAMIEGEIRDARREIERKRTAASQSSGDPVVSSDTSSSTRTRLEGPILPEQLDAAGRARMLKELAELKIELPSPPSFPEERWRIVQLASGDEIAGELIAEKDGNLQIRDVGSGELRTVTANFVVWSVKGKSYDTRPPKTIRTRDGKRASGEIESATSGGLTMKNGNRTRYYQRKEIEPVDFFQAYRSINKATKPKHHFEIGRVAFRMGLSAEARRELLEATRGEDSVRLLTLPYLDPKGFARWYFSTSRTPRQNKRMLGWAREQEPAVAALLIEGLLQNTDLPTREPMVRVELARLMLKAKRYEEAERYLERLIRNSGNSDVGFEAEQLKQSIQKVREEAQRAELIAKQRQVYSRLLAMIEVRAGELAKLERWNQAALRARMRPTLDLLLIQLSADLGLALPLVREAYVKRGHMLPRREQKTIEYGPSTWLVDTPFLLRIELGAEKVAEMQQAFWSKLDEPRRAALLQGLLFEAWFNVTVTRSDCPTCRGARTMDDVETSEGRADRIDPTCHGTGYHRTVVAR